jgi:hypothetical protein
LNPLATKVKVRDAKGDTVKKMIEETAQPVIDMLNLRFGRMTYDGKPMKVGEKATTDSIAAMVVCSRCSATTRILANRTPTSCSSYRSSRSSSPST